jgi:hypothetical protein
MNPATQTEGVTLGGHWILTFIMILVGIWIVVKYPAPRSSKEWRNVGVLQAFIIALLAERHSSAEFFSPSLKEIYGIRFESCRGKELNGQHVITEYSK